MVGISLDGDRAANDLHRRYANGRSSYDQVLRAVGTQTAAARVREHDIILTARWLSEPAT